MVQKNPNAAVAGGDNVNLYEQQPTQTQSGEVSANDIPKAPTHEITPPPSVSEPNLGQQTNNQTPTETKVETPVITNTTTSNQNSPTPIMDNIGEYSLRMQDLGVEASNLSKSNAVGTALNRMKNAINEGTKAEENLVGLQIDEERNNHLATIQANNDYINLISESYNRTSDVYKQLGIDVDNDIIENKAFYKKAINQREKDRSQALFNQQQFLAETARLSGYGLGSNAAAYVAGKMLSFTSEYDIQTEQMYNRGATLSSKLRSERVSLENDLSTLANQFASRKKEAYIEAKKAENAVKYLTEGSASIKKQKINEIRQKAQKQIADIERQFYTDIDDRIGLVSNAFKNEVSFNKTAQEVALTEFNNISKNGNIYNMSDYELEKYSRVLGLTPQQLRDLAKKDNITSDLMRLITLGNLDKKDLALMEMDVIDLMKKGWSKEDAIQYVADEKKVGDIYQKMKYEQLTGTSLSLQAEASTTINGTTKEEVIKQAELLKEQYPYLDTKGIIGNDKNGYQLIMWKEDPKKTKKDTSENGGKSLFGGGGTSSSSQTSFDGTEDTGLSTSLSLDGTSDSTTTTTTTSSESNNQPTQSPPSIQEQLEAIENTEQYTTGRYDYNTRGTSDFHDELGDGYVAGQDWIRGIVYKGVPVGKIHLVKPEDIKKGYDNLTKLVMKKPPVASEEQQAQFNIQEKRNYLIEQNAYALGQAFQAYVARQKSAGKEFVYGSDLSKYDATFTESAGNIIKEFTNKYKELSGWEDFVYDIGGDGDIQDLLFNEMFVQLQRAEIKEQK